jgi:two-component system chemotaxis sensor kinase CheA
MVEIDLSEFKGVFLEEVDEHLQIIEESILELEQHGESAEVIQKLFRAAHTIKGSSAAMGLETMKQLTHEMEHILDMVRNKRLAIGPHLISILFDSLDCLRELKEEFVSNQPKNIEIAPLVAEIRRIADLDRLGKD